MNPKLLVSTLTITIYHITNLDDLDKVDSLLLVKWLLQSTKNILVAHKSFSQNNQMSTTIQSKQSLIQDILRKYVSDFYNLHKII